MRALLGQQISVAAARTLAGRLTAELGEPLAAPRGGVTHVFPTPAALAALDPESLPMPRARGRALVRLAAALADGEPVDERLPGIGPWTTAYVALRSGDDDAFLPTDLGVKHGLAALGADPRRAAELAEAWRPYRGFAVAHLWAAACGRSANAVRRCGTAREESGSVGAAARRTSADRGRSLSRNGRRTTTP